MALSVGFSIAMPDTFASWGNFRVMVTSQTIVLFLAIAATFVLRAGEFDLSLGSVMAFTAVALGVLTEHGVNLTLSLVIVLLAGALIGLVNGVLVVRLRVNSFIATLGMLTVLSGATFALTGGRRADVYPAGLQDAVNKEILGLPALTYAGWLLVIVVWYVYEKAPVGRMLLFTGGNPEAARLSGIPVDRLKITSFLVAAVLSAVAGLLIAGYLGSVDPGIGSSYLMTPFAAAFLGATTIEVGRYNAFGTFVGLCLLTVGITGLQLMGGALWVSDVFNGAALIVAVVFGMAVGRARG
ncbi:ABC transporter permease [Amycolatopsis panacis]|uniref:ABC transporter permease n=1 Tax=Amycolatopsis panacis TaxID=2340917 RepID=UPI001314E81D|nr:ABC transporter permease [Amycolatopsis panacis]